jgi:hypothetical protein
VSDVASPVLAGFVVTLIGVVEVVLRSIAAAISAGAGLGELLWWLYRRTPTVP